jgi:hypothetical protein
LAVSEGRVMTYLIAILCSLLLLWLLLVCVVVWIVQ